MEGAWALEYPPQGATNHYQYNGIELQEDFGLNWNLAFYRGYDPALGRWGQVDPVDQPSLSPYNGMGNNPIYNTDVLGNTVESTHTDAEGNVIAVYDDGDNGVYRHDDISGDLSLDQRHSLVDLKRSETNITGGNGELMGQTPIWDSFWDHRSQRPWGQIDFGSFEAADEIIKFENRMAKMYGEGDEGYATWTYMKNAGTWGSFDFKSEGGDREWSEETLTHYRYRGSQALPGLYVSARDVGNFEAGMVTGMFGIPSFESAKVRGAFNAVDNKLSDVFGLAKNLFFNWDVGYGEDINSYKMQVRGQYYGETIQNKIYKKARK